MPDHFTTRLALPYPDIDDPADVPTDMQQLAERLDLLIPAGSGAGLALNRATVGDVGMAGQVRAGRQLAPADFTNLGLSAPRGLWNLSDLTDASGNGRTLVNKGAVTFAPGINGLAATAAQFTGSTAQALYLADTGAADPFRISTGSWGCWMRTAKRGGGTAQHAITKIGAAGTNAASLFSMGVNGNMQAFGSACDGTNAAQPIGVSDVADDRWHFVVTTHDGTITRLYVDGVLEASASGAGAINATAAAPLNIGGFAADGATAAAQPHYGRVDEAFVTADVLTDDQVRSLYCARLPHTLAIVPTGAKLNVTRRRRGGAWAVADFPVQPLRLYNFTAGALADQGSQNVAVAFDNVGTSRAVAAPDGLSGNAVNANSSWQATDAGLPSLLASRSYGCWFKSVVTTGVVSLIGWGAGASSACGASLGLSSGAIYTQSVAQSAVVGPFSADGAWHFAVVVEDNTAIDGVKQKLYIDGRLVAGGTALGSIALGGANRFRIGAYPDSTGYYTGSSDGVFITDQVLTAAQIAALWTKGTQALAPSPKNAGDHIEGWDAAAIYATFDALDTNAQIDLGVAA